MPNTINFKEKAYELKKNTNLFLLWADQIRIKHWIKNVFVFSPLIFAEQFLELGPLLKSILSFVIFCLLASSIYILNDIIDIENDKNHPVKKHRPIASGDISKKNAWWVSFFICLFGFSLCSLSNLSFFIIAIFYVLNNLAYSLYIKNKVVADVISISIGFMLRFLGGAFVIEVEYSKWFLICAFSLSLFLSFGKRRTEIEMLGEGSLKTRLVFESYTKEKLDTALATACSMCILTYMLFAVDIETVEKHQTTLFVYTVPIVVYCLLRYMFKVQEGKGVGPVDILFKDKAFVLSGICWLIMSLLILYYF